MQVKNAYQRRAHAWFVRHKIRAFFNVIDDDDFEKGSKALIQLAGIGRLKPNMLLMGYKADWRTCAKDDLIQYVNTVQ
jgi:solute carrier family 12 sodium/potassium/chloride transporter 2